MAQKPTGKRRPNLTPLFHLAGELGIRDFVMVGIDSQGNSVVAESTGSPAGMRALRGFTEDWLDLQDQLHPVQLPWEG